MTARPARGGGAAGAARAARPRGRRGGGAAARAGVRAGDLIVAIDGRPPEDVLDLDSGGRRRRASRSRSSVTVARSTLHVALRRGEDHGLDACATAWACRCGAAPTTARSASSTSSRRPAAVALGARRRLPPLVPAGHVHHADQPRRARPRAHRRPAAVAALRLAARLGRRRARAPDGSAARVRARQRLARLPPAASSCTCRSCCARA